MTNILKNVTDGLNTVDKFHESGQERSKTLSDRHKVDMASDSWLSKSIRPLTLLVLLAVVSIIGLMSAFGKHADPMIMGQLVALLGTAIGFYFQSKKNERIAEKNASANIKLERMRAKNDIKTTKRELRHERRQARRAERNQDKEDHQPNQ